MVQLMKYKYKDFVKSSKLLMGYKSKNKWEKVKLTLKFPLKYLQFKHVLKHTKAIKGDN